MSPLRRTSPARRHPRVRVVAAAATVRSACSPTSAMHRRRRILPSSGFRRGRAGSPDGTSASTARARWTATSA
ncbi:50S ribosomal protein L32 [Nocardia beijingensis]|nr:50S ribosomal protein L32 [Nocardia beijingensis]